MLQPLPFTSLLLFYAPAPSPPLGFYFYGGRLHDWQTRGLGGYANGLSANGFSDSSVADSRVSTNQAIVSDRISLGSAELVGLQLSARPRRPVIERIAGKSHPSD